MRKAERTKQFILEQASVILNEKGIAGLTVDTVLAAANVARGCLYNHFENRDVLCIETADYLLRKNDEMIIEIMLKDKSAKAKIYAYLKFNSDPLNSYIAGGCPIFNLAAEADDNHPAIKEMVRNTMLQAQKFFASILAEGVKNAEFTNKLNVSEFAWKIFSSVQGGILISRTLHSAQPMQLIIKSLKSELKAYEV